MKIKNKNVGSVVALVGLVLIATTSCVDELKFGNAFLEKAPGGTVTADTVFNNAEYTRQFLTTIYAYQYYGLPYVNDQSMAWVNNPYVGKFEVLSDCWHNHWSSTAMTSEYYSGAHTSGYGRYQDKFDYLHNKVWEAVRAAWLLIELPVMEDIKTSSIICTIKYGKQFVQPGF